MEVKEENFLEEFGEEKCSKMIEHTLRHDIRRIAERYFGG